MNAQSLPISIIIPTYQREQILLDTINYLLNLPTKAQEIVIVDQTKNHEPKVETQLKEWHDQKIINWVKLLQPSIPHAMNQGMLAAKYDLVLYLDDDIIPEPELIQAHWNAHQKYPHTLIAGRVIQPWEEGKIIEQSVPGNGTCATTQSAWIEFFMGGNFSINREQSIKLGGFDENFVGVAYQFEAEFAHRYLKSGNQIFFEPKACIHHLKVSNGGTRSYGEHLTTWKPHHAVGAYYYLLKSQTFPHIITKISKRFSFSIITRHHLKKPWWIPATLISELIGLFWAVNLVIKGTHYINVNSIKTHE